MNQAMKRGMKHQKGFSVLELMVALGLGLLVVAGIVQLFVGNSRTYEIVNAQARLQENARFAFEFISRPARMAGYYGCAPELNNMVSQLNGIWENTPEYDITQPVDGWNSNDDNTWGPDNLTSLPRTEGTTNTRVDIPGNGIDRTTLQASSDLLVFRMIRQPFAQLAETLQPDGVPVVLTPGGQPVFQDNDVVVVADCEQATVFKITDVAAVGDEVTLSRDTAAGTFANGTNVVTPTGDIIPATLSLIGRSYGETATVGVIESHFFFIAESTDSDRFGDPVFALWEKVGADAPRELVQGVDDMQVLFGIDTSGAAVPAVERYVSVQTMQDLRDASPLAPLAIAAVQVRLRITSVEPLSEFGNQPMERTFTKTIHVRNFG